MSQEDEEKTGQEQKETGTEEELKNIFYPDLPQKDALEVPVNERGHFIVLEREDNEDKKVLVISFEKPEDDTRAFPREVADVITAHGETIRIDLGTLHGDKLYRDKFADVFFLITQFSGIDVTFEQSSSDSMPSSDPIIPDAEKSPEVKSGRELLLESLSDKLQVIEEKFANQNVTDTNYKDVRKELNSVIAQASRGSEAQEVNNEARIFYQSQIREYEESGSADARTNNRDEEIAALAKEFIDKELGEFKREDMLIMSRWFGTEGEDKGKEFYRLYLDPAVAHQLGMENAWELDDTVHASVTDLIQRINVVFTQLAPFEVARQRSQLEVAQSEQVESGETKEQEAENVLLRLEELTKNFGEANLEHHVEVEEDPETISKGLGEFQRRLDMLLTQAVDAGILYPYLSLARDLEQGQRTEELRKIRERFPAAKEKLTQELLEKNLVYDDVVIERGTTRILLSTDVAREADIVSGQELDDKQKQLVEKFLARAKLLMARFSAIGQLNRERQRKITRQSPGAPEPLSREQRDKAQAAKVHAQTLRAVEYGRNQMRGEAKQQIAEIIKLQLQRTLSRIDLSGSLKQPAVEIFEEERSRLEQSGLPTEEAEHQAQEIMEKVLDMLLKK